MGITAVKVSKCIFFSLYFTVFFATSASVTIELHGEDNYPPFSDKQKNGLSHQIIQAAYNAVDIDVNFVSMPFARIMKMLDNNMALGGFNVVKTSQDEEKYLFTKSPIYTVKTHFYYLKSKPLQVKQLSDLNDPSLVVGEVTGFMYEKEFLNLTFSRHKVRTEEQLVEMLALGRIDAAYITKEAELYYRKKLNIADDQIGFLKDIGVYVVPLHLAFNKQHLDAKKYAKFFNKGMNMIKNNGIYSEIVRNFNGEINQAD